MRRHLEFMDEAGFASIPSAETRPSPTVQTPFAAPQLLNEKVIPTIAPAAGDARRSMAPVRGEVQRSAAEKVSALDAIRNQVVNCKLCRLCETRTHAVPGEGNAAARVLFVGEGPGQTEDELGRPFVGRAGQLLTKIIESGMGLERKDVFIANIVKCRPPENRDPMPDEVAACLPYLNKQIEVIDPEVVIPLGRHSMRELAGAGERDTISRVRGKVYHLNGRAVIPTFHPAYLLRNPAEKVKVWNDIQLAMKELGIPIPKQSKE
ncbi:MAG: uracil-DNA glycosylase family protein [Planctomycetota bacterium]